MSRSVTQNQAADLVAILSDSSNSPVTGLVYTDVSVEYAKEGGSFAAKSLAPTSASITSGNTETFALSDGQTLTVSVDGGGDQTATFNTGDFGDIANATAAEVAAVIDADLTGASAAASAGAVVITSDLTGETSSLQVTGGTANAALGFATAQENGSTFFKEVGSGVYTIEFTATELDTLGSFIFKVNGASIQQFVGVADVVAQGQATSSVSLETCIISGHVLDVAGKPIPNATVSARILGAPAISGVVGLGEDRAYAVTNSSGEFFIELVRLAYVDITISKMNYRRQLTVPNQASANLFTIA